MKRQISLGILFAGAAALLSSCGITKDRVVATSTTVIGVQIHQKDSDKTPEVKIGYARGELAIVPTDKGKKKGDASSGSAKDSAEVLMEINAQGNLTLGTVYQGGVYQRLAVGKTAVQQPGAAYMMAKDKNGKIDPATADTVSESIKASARESVASENTQADELATFTDNGSGKVDQAKLDALVKGTLIEGKVSKYYGSSIDGLKTKLMGSWRHYIPQMMENKK